MLTTNVILKYKHCITCHYNKKKHVSKLQILINTVLHKPITQARLFSYVGSFIIYFQSGTFNSRNSAFFK
jgi:hypothetical protein